MSDWICPISNDFLLLFINFCPFICLILRAGISLSSLHFGGSDRKNKHFNTKSRANCKRKKELNKRKKRAKKKKPKRERERYRMG